MKKMSQEELKIFKFDMLKHQSYGFNMPTDNEYEIMNIVSKNLKNDIVTCSESNYINADSAIESGLLSLAILNKKYINKLKKLIFYVYDDLNENDFRAMIEYNGKQCNVREIMMPLKINEVSPIWIGHECIHCLKDTNYNEYINKDITSEVITIFYEILVSKTIYKNIHNKWKKERMKILLYDKACYDFAMNNLNKDDDTSIYNYIMYSYGQYLTSYYYALNLFNLYKNAPAIVIKNINKVLNHKKTTLDLLNEFDIYKINKEHVNIYKLEHSKL